MFGKEIFSSSALLFLVFTCVRADLRSTVYDLVVARSGAQSNCTRWTSFFASSGVVRSPVGSTPAVGPPAIQKHCEAWNANLGPQGNGWYPMEFWSGNGEVAFEATVRAVNKGGCQVNLRGILVVKFDSNLKVSEWNHYYDSDFVGPQIQGKCQVQ